MKKPESVRLRQAATATRIAAFIREYTLEHGWAPSQREITEALGCSLNTTNLGLARLAEEGIIDMEPGVPRAVRIVGTKMVIPEVSM
jgi:SOS-response transcriptional repressor LexA